MAASFDLALLILRVVAGLTLAAHGAQKVFGWFGGPGFAGLQQGFEKQGFKPTWLWVSLVILGELGGGLALALGLLTPLGAAAGVGAMAMAMVKVHWKNGFFASKGGIEYTLILLTVSLFLGLVGPGSYSLDSALGLTFPPALFYGLTLAALVIDAIGLAISRPATLPAESKARA